MVAEFIFKITNKFFLVSNATPLVSSIDETSPPSEHLENKTDAGFVLFLVNSN